jgi:hypothetical protein
MTRFGRRLGGAAALGTLLLAAAPALAAPVAEDTPPVADKELHDFIRKQAERIESLEKRLSAVEGGASAASANAVDEAVKRYLADREAAGDTYTLGGVARPSNDDFQLGGYMTLNYRSFDGDGRYPSFEGYRVILQTAFNISKGIDFATEIEYERGGAGVPYLTSNYILVEYAEVRFDVSDAFVPKAGILLIPFLRYNLYHDDPIWNLSERPFTATRSFRASLQQPGVGAEGVLPVGDSGTTFNYNFAITNGLNDNIGNAGVAGGRQDFRADNNHDKTVWLRTGLAPRTPFFDAVDLGFSVARGKLDTDGDVLMNGWGLDGKLTKGRFDVIFEWTKFDFDRPSSVPLASKPRGLEGGFVQLDTRLINGFTPSQNGIVGATSSLTLALRYEWADTNDRVTGASLQDGSRCIAIGLAFRPTPKTVIRIERREESSSFRDDTANEQDQWILSLSTYF